MPRKKKSIAVHDKWKFKRWVLVYSPDYLGLRPLVEIPVTHDSVFRTVEIPLNDLINTTDPSARYKKVKLQILKEVDNKAFTEVKYYELQRDYLGSMIRRGISKVVMIFNITTADNLQYQVQAMTLTARRARYRQANRIRKLMQQYITEQAQKMNHDEFVKKIITGEFAKEYKRLVFKVAPILEDGCHVIKLKLLTPAAELQKNFNVDVTKVRDVTPVL